MAGGWDDMTCDEKLESLRRDVTRMVQVLTELMSDVDGGWAVMRGTSSQLGRINKDVATLKALWPHTKKYARQLEPPALPRD